jgi:hypothetical protein
MLDGWQWHDAVWWASFKLLEHANKEDIVDESFGRQLKMIGDGTNTTKHLVWSIEVRIKFGLLQLSDFDCIAMVQPEPNPIAFLECQLLMFLVMLLFHDVL